VFCVVGDCVSMHPSGGGLSASDSLAYNVTGAARWCLSDNIRPLWPSIALTERFVFLFFFHFVGEINLELFFSLVRACQLIKDGVGDELLEHVDLLFEHSKGSKLVTSCLLPPMLSYLSLWPQSLVRFDMHCEGESLSRVLTHIFPSHLWLRCPPKWPCTCILCLKTA